MKKFLMTSAIAMTMATASFADDFTTTTGNLDFYFGDFVLKTNTNHDIALGYYAFPHPSVIGVGHVYLEAGTNLDTEDSRFRVEYFVGTDNGNVGVYAAPAFEYWTSNEEWVFDPYLGVSFGLGASVLGFAEVGTTLLVDGWDTVGSYVEVGADFTVSDNVTITPSLVHSFDVPVDNTQLEVTVSVVF